MFVLVFIGGIIAWNNTSKEEMPDIEFDHAHVSARYPGATAEEVEHFLTKPLEDQIKGLDGVYRVSSTSSDGGTSISIDFEKDYSNLDEAVMEVRNAVLDTDLPDDVIDEINKLEDNKFSKITHTIQLRKLIIEWLRLTDQLVENNKIVYNGSK